MDGINPLQANYQTSGARSLHSLTGTEGAGRVIGVARNGDMPSETAGTQGQGNAGQSQGAANRLVPEEGRMNELENLFDDKTLKRMGVIECETCSTRTYQDGSEDPGVSFKAPTRLSPGQAATAVMSHEMEHVVNEQAHAERDDREVINQSVQIFHDVCPECGKNYVSGGLTRTTTAGKAQEAYSPYGNEDMEGNLVDMAL